MVERIPDKDEVEGSSPSSRIVAVVQLVEHWVVIPKVASSNLVGHL